MGPHITLIHRFMGIAVGLQSVYWPLVTLVHMPAMMMGFLTGTPSIYTAAQLVFMLRLQCAGVLSNYLFECHEAILTGYQLSERTMGNIPWMSYCQHSLSFFFPHHPSFFLP